MPVRIQIAQLEDRALWDDLQRAASIASHGWSFNRALALSGNRPQLAFVHDRSSVLTFPFFERHWKGRTDICTTLSVSGACLIGAEAGLLMAWAEFAAARQWVAGYIQFEPETDMTGIPGGETGNSVFLLDLAADDPLAAASAIIRRKIRKAHDAGFSLIEDRDVLTGHIAPLYAATMARSGASSAYDMPEAALQAMVRSSEHLVLGAGRDGEITAIMVFPVSRERAEYHIGASTEAGRDATAWLMSQAASRLKAIGVKQLNLGGGVRPRDGLYDFKLKFGAVPKPLHHVKQIYDAGAYETFCRKENAAADENWFPAYRAGAARRPFASGRSAIRPENATPGDEIVEAHAEEAPHRVV